MTSYGSMTQKLAPLGIYDLEDGTRNALELRVFADELDRLFDTLDEMEREFFIATAQSWGIAMRERFTGKEKSSLPVEKRRELLTIAEYVTGVDPTPQGFEDFVRVCGIEDFTYQEVGSHAKLNLTIREDLDSGEKKLLEERINAYIPAHCTVNIRYNPNT